VTPAFIYAALLWDPMRELLEHYRGDDLPILAAMQHAADEVVSNQSKHTALPRRVTLPMREIWTLQERLKNTAGKRPMRLREHPRFRAAYDFMLLRNEAGEELGELSDWWTKFQESDPIVASVASPSRRNRVPRRRRGRRRPLPEARN
jgi:poly(A) polymerase